MIAGISCDFHVILPLFCVWRFWSPIFWCRVCRVMWTSSWMVNSMWFKRSLALEDVGAYNCIDGKCTHATMSQDIKQKCEQNGSTSWDVRRPWQHRTVWFAALWRVSVIRWPSSWSGPEMVLRSRNGWHAWNIQNIPPFREEKKWKNEKLCGWKMFQWCLMSMWCQKTWEIKSLTFHDLSYIFHDVLWSGGVPEFWWGITSHAADSIW